MLHRERHTHTNTKIVEREREREREKTYVARTHQIWPSTRVGHMLDMGTGKTHLKNVPSAYLEIKKKNFVYVADTFETCWVRPRHRIV